MLIFINTCHSLTLTLFSYKFVITSLDLNILSTYTRAAKVKMSSIYLFKVIYKQKSAPIYTKKKSTKVLNMLSSSHELTKKEFACLREPADRF